MRKYSTLLLSGLILAFFAITISACDDDEEPFVKPKLSFSEATITVNEADGVLEIEVTLDKPATEDITISYELGGTAVDEVTANSEDLASDYEITSEYLEIEIEEGETTGIIEIQLFSDFQIDNNETIEISITEVDSDDIEITREDEIEITIKQEDGMAIVLDWESSSIDMDLIVRIGETVGTWDGVLTGSLYGFPEITFLPKVIDDGAAFGLSYTYYDGALADDTLDFAVSFIDIVNGVVEEEADMEIYEEYYLAVNKNKWNNVTETLVVQTCQKISGAYTNFSDIVIPETGSRLESGDNFSTPLKRSQITSDRSAKLQSTIKRLNQ